MTTEERAVKVLLVEDSLTQALELQDALEAAGFAVEIAADGEQGLALFTSGGFDLVLSDVLMPGISGYELCRALKAIPGGAQAPVILLTTLAEPLDVIRGLECGADGYLSKPCDPEFLIERIRSILANRRARVDRTGGGIPLLLFDHEFSISSTPEQVLDFLVSSFADVVAGRKREQELLRTEREHVVELKRLNEEKSRLLGMAAHDLRNPLSVIRTFAEFVLNDLGPGSKPEHRQFVGQIRSTTEFMLRLIDNILDLAKIQSGKVQLKLAPTDLVDLVEKNAALNRYLAEKKKISLAVKADGSIPRAMIDAMRIEQVLNNLVSNAIKFSHENTAIEVRVTGSEREITVAVIDQGQGIPPHEVEKLFQPFQKLSTRSTAGEKSTGLGLAISKRVVEDHGGRIWCESEETQGSTFAFAVPVAPA